MSNTLRKLKRQQDRDSVELRPEEQRLPTGRIVGDPLKGEFLSLPLLGWVSKRERDQIPLIMLHLALLDDEYALRGALEVELPLYIDTEMATLAALERYGWSGQTWALGEPAPAGNATLGTLLTDLITKASQNLEATLVFTADPTPTQPVEVTRAQGRFLMPPLPPPSDPPAPERIEALRAIVLDYRRFFKKPSSGRDESTCEAASRVECLNCGERATSSGPVPLCDKCGQLSRDHGRGVRFQTPPPEGGEPSSSGPGDEARAPERTS